MLLLVAYGQRDPSAYHFNRHLEHSFTKGFSTVLSFQQFFTWANTTLVSNLYSHYPGIVPSPGCVLAPFTLLSWNSSGSLPQPYREPITTEPYALKERPSEGP